MQAYDAYYKSGGDNSGALVGVYSERLGLWQVAQYKITLAP
jgi:hypothetical protein